MESVLHTTGSEPLDRILGGGLPDGSMVILAGLPGTGKTILAEQFLFANAAPGKPALYLTTLSEPLSKTIRYLQRFSFFDPSRLPGVIDYRDLAEPIRERGIETLPTLVTDLLLQRDYAFVVIDSFKALHDISADHVNFRAVLFDVGRIFAAHGVTALLVGEYSPVEIGALPEFAVADGVIELTNRSLGVRDERALRVHKLRGAAPLPGEHSFRIDRNGLCVFPRLVGAELERVDPPDEKVPIGVPGLDGLMGGGVQLGSTTLVEGPTGIGKTRLCLRYLLEGALRGEAGALVTFQEGPNIIRRMVAAAGADLRALQEINRLQVLYVPPLELDLVELFGQITALVGRGDARRLVIDALGDVRNAAIEPGRLRAMAWSLVQYVRLGGLTALLILETPREPGAPRSQEEVSYLADNIVGLRYLDPLHGDFDRALQVIKTRAAAHDPRLYPFRITAGGPEVVTEGVLR